MQRRFLGYSLATAAAGCCRARVAVAVFGLLVAAAAVPLMAHHAIQAEFDYELEVMLTGTLQKIEWVNPHSVFYLDVTDESGTVTTWTVSTLGGNGLRRSGLSRRGFFNVGETYTFTMYKALDGSNFAWLRDITFPDGRVVTVWFGDDSGV